MNKTLVFILLLLTGNLCMLSAQNHEVRGTVSTEGVTGGFTGASVIIKGTTIGTVTNEKGEYILSVPSSATTLIFSAAGMQTIEELTGARSRINIQFRPGISQLNEVVITALGTRADRDKFASSVSTVQGKNLAKSGETGMLTGLSGKTSGVIVTRNGGDPGAGAYIRIRGQNTINGNAQPLFIVDGMPVSNASDNLGASAANGIIQQSRINDINPDDIDRVEVLKGASAAALWGTRAANGVIVITTKKGKDTDGKVSISLNQRCHLTK